MELYERVKKCAALMHLSESAFARALGLKQSTWAGYLNAERQHKLWPLLPAILQEFPRISRQWLYFEEGPAVIGLGTPADQPVPPARIVEAAEQMVRDCDGSWATLLEYITGMARQELTASRKEPANEELVQRLLVLQEENRRLQQELHQAKDKIIALLEQQAAAQAEKEAPAASMPGTTRGSRPNMI